VIEIFDLIARENLKFRFYYPTDCAATA